jgi:hypothetical protein
MGSVEEGLNRFHIVFSQCLGISLRSVDRIKERGLVKARKQLTYFLDDGSEVYLEGFHHALTSRFKAPNSKLL